MSEVKQRTTLDMLNLLTDFLERKGLWEGEYAFDRTNFKMHFWIFEDHSKLHPCGTVGCIAGHMASNSIWKAMGLELKAAVEYMNTDNISNIRMPFYDGDWSYEGLRRLFKITSYEASYIFSNNDANIATGLKGAIERINKIKKLYSL